MWEGKCHYERSTERRDPKKWTVTHSERSFSKVSNGSASFFIHVAGLYDELAAAMYGKREAVAEEFAETWLCIHHGYDPKAVIDIARATGVDPSRVTWQILKNAQDAYFQSVCDARDRKHFEEEALRERINDLLKAHIRSSSAHGGGTSNDNEQQ